MNIKVCKRCKKLFSTINNQVICQECIKKEDEMFEVVKAYLKNNKTASLEQISKDTEVSVKLIQKFIKAGRLEAVNDLELGPTCKICHKIISTGQVCNNCLKQFKDFSTFKNVTPLEGSERNKGMHSNLFTSNKK